MNLADHPDEPFATAENDEAKAFLLQEGLLGELEKGGAGKRALPNQCRRLDVRTHRTHWITVIAFSGFKRPEENGYIVRCLPKSKVTLETFEAQIKAEQDELFPYGMTKRDGQRPPTGTN